MRFDPELSICGLLGVNLCRESRQNTPRCLTERTRTLLSDGRPLQSQRRSHFSSACQLGISTTASAAGPKSPPPLPIPPLTSVVLRHYPSSSEPPSRPNVGLRHSLLVTWPSMLGRDPSTAGCQHSSLTGVLLEGFPVGFHASVE